MSRNQSRDIDVENPQHIVVTDDVPHGTLKEPLQEPVPQVSVWKTHLCMGVAAAAIIAIVIVLAVVLSDD